MIEDIRKLLDDYATWLRDSTALRKVGERYVEITTPYLDRNNDHLQIYARREDGGFLLTDDAETIVELRHSGCELDTVKRRDLLRTTLNGFGVEMVDDALQIHATAETFPKKKHALLQAMLSVNDMFYLAGPTVASLFQEDVERWLGAADVRFIAGVKFTGKSGFDHRFDFAVPASRVSPERLINAISHPTRTAASALAFSWMDTRDKRSLESQCFAILNDNERAVTSTVLSALRNYGITPVKWTERDLILPEINN
jgi:hypothetical protein